LLFGALLSGYNWLAVRTLTAFRRSLRLLVPAGLASLLGGLIALIVGVV